MVLIGWLVLGLVATKVLATMRSPHAAWPLVLAMVYALGQTYGYPLFLVYLKFAIPWIVMAWGIVAVVIVAVTIAVNYAWTCSNTAAVPSFAGYKRLAVEYTARFLRRTRKTNR